MTRQQFILCVESNQRAVRRFLTALCCGDTALADDLAQDTFVKAYVASDSFRDETKFVAWIFRIAYNTFVSNRRSARYFEPLTEAGFLPSESKADGKYDYQDLNQALGRLTEKERTVIVLHYIEGYSVKEIADITVSGTDAVKQLLSRGRNRLKNILKNILT